jgi:cyclic pyranopterin phosphate synthase
MWVDTFGRTITYLRISVTDRCNLRCVYCMPREGLQWQRRADPLVHAGLKRVNISLDTLQAEKFSHITRGGEIERVWKGIAAAERVGLAPIKLNTVIVRGLNSDEMIPLARLTIENEWHVRFIELMPIGNVQEWGVDFPAPNVRYVSVQEMHSALSAFGLQDATEPHGNGPARTFRIPGALGTVGFISPLGEHFCQNCNRLRLTSDGKLRPCLAIPREVSLRDALRSGEPLGEYFRRAVAQKPEHHDMQAAASARSQRSMSQIGG